MDSKNPVIMIEGSIGESSSFFSTSLSQAETLTIDFKDATYMNSVGVKSWVSWIQKAKPGLKVELRNCSPLIINQMNIVKGFIPDTTVVSSFYVPYLCEECENEEQVRLSAPENYPLPTAGNRQEVEFILPNVPCKKCQHPMEPDCLIDRYFSFMQKMGITVRTGS